VFCRFTSARVKPAGPAIVLASDSSSDPGNAPCLPAPPPPKLKFSPPSPPCPPEPKRPKAPLP